MGKFWFEVIQRAFSSTLSAIGKDPSDLRFSILVALLIFLAVCLAEGFDSGRRTMKARLRKMATKEAIVIAVVCLLLFIFNMFREPFNMLKEETSRYLDANGKYELEHQTLVKLKEDNAPAFVVTILDVGNATPMPHSTDPPLPDDTALIMFAVRLENRGAPSTTKTWTCTVITKDNVKHTTMHLVYDFKGMVERSRKSLHTVPSDVVLHGAVDISSKTSQIAVEHNRAALGFIFFAVPGVTLDRAREKGNKLVLSFLDIDDKPYTIEMEGSGILGRVGVDAPETLMR